MFELIFQHLQKPLNVGAAVRLSCATGSKLYLTGESLDHRSRKAKSGAVGYDELAEVVYEKDISALIERLRGEGKQIIGAAPRAEKLYTEIDYTRPTVLVFGNEISGLGKSTLALMDDVITVPMPGGIESLNVVMCAAVILYEGLRQRGFSAERGIIDRINRI